MKPTAYPWSAPLQTAFLAQQRWFRHLARWMAEAVPPPGPMHRAPVLIPIRRDDPSAKRPTPRHRTPR